MGLKDPEKKHWSFNILPTCIFSARIRKQINKQIKDNNPEASTISYPSYPTTTSTKRAFSLGGNTIKGIILMKEKPNCQRNFSYVLRACK